MDLGGFCDSFYEILSSWVESKKESQRILWSRCGNGRGGIG